MQKGVMFTVRHLNSRLLIYILLCFLAILVVFQLGAETGRRSAHSIERALPQNPRDPKERDFYLRREPLDETATVGESLPDDEHKRVMKEQSLSPFRPKRTPYAPRLNMGECKKTFGNVIVFVAVVESSYKTHYRVAQQSLECYLKSTNYTFLLIDLDHDERVNKFCKHDQLFFKKHCAASVYLADADWMLVLDADAGVVNPNHCIEEWIDDRVDLVFYERYFNWEIASGNYLVRNTEFARNFLMKWADWQFIQPQNWNGADNGVLQIHILQTVLPDARAEIKACDAVWHRGNNYETYMAYVTCVKVTLGAKRLYPGMLRIHRRGHGWVRDGYMTADSWSEFDFMLHGWKAQEINTNGWSSPYTSMFNVSECGNGYSGWNWRKEKRVSVDAIRTQLANFEKSVGSSFPKEARIHPYLSEPDVGECYPNCDDRT